MIHYTAKKRFISSVSTCCLGMPNTSPPSRKVPLLNNIVKAYTRIYSITRKCFVMCYL